jgi:hypothetical protein
MGCIPTQLARKRATFIDPAHEGSAIQAPIGRAQALDGDPCITSFLH